jgi:hypothetical protein
MSHCLSDEALFECYSGEGEPGALEHLKSCLACTGRFKVLQGEMTLISQALEMAPPRRRAATASGFAGWRIAVSALALAAAFTVGWSLRSTSLAPSAQIASRQSAPPAPIELSRLESGPTPAVYAEYVQGAFEGDSCADSDDPLGCQ